MPQTPDVTAALSIVQTFAGRDRAPAENETYQAALKTLTAYLARGSADETALAKTGLSVRAINVLDTAGIHSRGQLLAITPAAFAELRHVRNCGDSCLKQIADFVFVNTGRKLLPAMVEAGENAA